MSTMYLATVLLLFCGYVHAIRLGPSCIGYGGQTYQTPQECHVIRECQTPCDRCHTTAIFEPVLEFSSPYIANGCQQCGCQLCSSQTPCQPTSLPIDVYSLENIGYVPECHGNILNTASLVDSSLCNCQYPLDGNRYPPLYSYGYECVSLPPLSPVNECGCGKYLRQVTLQPPCL